MTRKLLDNITEAAMGQAVKPGGRTLARLAKHLIHTLLIAETGQIDHRRCCIRAVRARKH